MVPSIQTAYDSILLNSQTQQPITVQQLAADLKDIDVVFLGEFHGNHASHLLQAQLQNLLYQQHPNQVLSMEQFNRDQQPILNRYLDGEIGEAYLINEAPAWDNYTASYRPLVEFAKQHFLPVIAANAPADTVRCIGRQGEGYLEKLTTEEASLIAEQPLEDVAGYRDFFMDFLNGSNHFDEGKANNSYLAQLSRDNTMAESILKAIRANPGAQVIHTNGAFHSNNGLGTVGALKRLDPNLTIKIISPVHVEVSEPMQFSSDAFETGDYIYLLQPQPEKYKSASYRQQAFKRMFDRADAKPCK
ncbi:MAG: ChaN family lipoprotein [Thiotrichales bacterium]|nr:ChaN family lipoprotein [Thiotrichales bacterium]